MWIAQLALVRLEKPTRHWLSIKDYYRMAEVGIIAPDARTELINGEIIDMAQIGNIHGGVVDQINRILVNAVGEKAIVRIQGAIELDAFSQVQSDAAVLCPRDDFYKTGEHNPSGSDTYLLIEVSVSSLKYDREVKAPLYAQREVPALLLISPEHNSVDYYSEPKDGVYQKQVRLEELQRVPVGTLGDVWMDLSGLL